LFCRLESRSNGLLTASQGQNDIYIGSFLNTQHYSPPPATVPIEHLGQYLHEQRLEIVRSFFTARGEFIVEVIDKLLSISTGMPITEERP
jgi:hypothetical protein